MASLGEQLRQMAERKKAAIEMAVRKTVLDLGASMVEMSPVDTGRFKNNWQYGVNAINYDASRSPGTSGADSLNAITTGVASWKPGETMFITNSLPYAYRLENGWSKKAPNGMVKVTLVNFEAHFNRALREAQA